jgi:glycosyltransferase involved in cell wall biosynthesis
VTADAPARVVLVRGLEDRTRPSMRRFGVELEGALMACTSVRLEPSMALRPIGVGRLDPYLARYARSPVALARRRRTHTVFHLTDHSDGHLAAITPPARTVVSCHDLMVLRAREGTAGFRSRPWTTARFAWSTSFLGRVARVVCGSEATKADVVRLRGVAPDRISVVPYGVSDRFQPLGAATRERVRSELGIPGPAILHVDSGQPYKNVAGTLRVLGALRSAGLEATLVRVGAWLTNAERALCGELHLDGAVRELGMVPDSRLVELYTAADVMLFPSHAEGFGWPVLEAMACGTPVVTSEAAALAEIVGEAGLRADAEDVSGLTDAVASLIADPQLARRQRALGRQRAAGFSWTRAAAGYAAVYATLRPGRL